MGKIAKFVGTVLVIGSAAVVAAIVLEDNEVRTKLAEGATEIKNTALEVKTTFMDGISKVKEDSEMTTVEQNQAWTEEQWEALGI